jgi:hypothetical protein
VCANAFPWSGRILRICCLLKKNRKPNLRVRLPYTGRHGKDTAVSGAQRILRIESSTLYRQRDNKNIPQELQTCRNSRCEQHVTGSYRLLHQPAFVASVCRCEQMSSACRHVVLLSMNHHSLAAQVDGRNVWLLKTHTHTHTHTSIYTYSTIYDIRIYINILIAFKRNLCDSTSER